MNSPMSDRVALILHLAPPAALDDEGLAAWWSAVGAPLVSTLTETSLPIGLALAGPLLGWIGDTRPPEHDALSALVASEQVELVTQPFHDPVVSAVPMDDFTDQVLSHLTLVRRLFEVRPQGAWLPRQVWDPIAPRVMGRADIRWVPVDDAAIATHHHVAGVDPWGAFRTEREGHPLTLLANDAGAQALRGLASPDEVIIYLRGRHSQGARDVVMSWEAVRHGQDPSQEMRWILGVIRALAAPGQGIDVDRPSAVADRVRGRVYLPSWAPEGVGVPWERRILENPAADRLHKRMLRVSRLLTRLTKRVRRGDPDAPDPDQLLQARRYLHRAQGAAHFEDDGIGDPFLRHRGWRDLLRAEDVAERAAGTWRRLAAEQVDLTTGGRQQIYLRTPSWVAVVDPGADGGCTELGFLPGAMNLVDPCLPDAQPPVGDAVAPPRVCRGAFAECFLGPDDVVGGVPAQPVPYEVHNVERSGDTSVRTMLSRSHRVQTDEGELTARVHKGFDVRTDDRVDVAIEIHLGGPEGKPLRSRFAVQIPLVIGTPFDDVVVKVDDKRKAIGSGPFEATDVRHIELEGDAVAVRLSVKERARIWIIPQALGAVVWVEWPLEVFSTAPKRLRLRLDARRVEHIDESDDGVPMRVLEEGPKVGDTVVLQRAVPVEAPAALAHAALTPAGVDHVSRALKLVPPREPVPRPQRLPLWAPPGSEAADVDETPEPAPDMVLSTPSSSAPEPPSPTPERAAEEAAADDDDWDPVVVQPPERFDDFGPGLVPDDPLDAPVAPARDDAPAGEALEAEE